MSPLPSTRVVHPRWAAKHGAVSDDAMNTQIRILAGTRTDWTPETGPIETAAEVLYAGPARVSYDLDRPFTKDNADQVTTTSVILVALPRDVVLSRLPGSGMTVKVDSVDANGLPEFVQSTLRILKARHSGLSFGIVMDCSEMSGRSNGGLPPDPTPVAPTVKVQPSSVYGAVVGSYVSFTSEAKGNPAPTVQWQQTSTAGGFDWTDIAGATSPTLGMLVAAAHSYRAIWTNAQGVAFSNPADLTVVI